MSEDEFEYRSDLVPDEDTFYNEQLKHFFSIVITSSIIYSGGAATALLAIFGESLLGVAEIAVPLMLIRVALSAFIISITLAILCTASALFAVDTWGEGLQRSEATNELVTPPRVYARGLRFRQAAFVLGVSAIASLVIGSVTILLMIMGIGH